MWSLSKLKENRAVWLRGLTRGSTLLSAVMIVLVWTSVAYHMRVERTDAERRAVQNSDNLARAFEEHLARSLNEIDRSLKIIRKNYAQAPSTFDLAGWLRATQLFDEQTLQVAIIGPRGFLKLSTVDSPGTVGTDLRDREHFRHFLATEKDELFISKPMIGRTTGKWSIQLARRIENRDGSFGGVIVASLDPNYLSRFYSSVDVGEDGYIRIIGIDGVVRAVGGRTGETLGRDLSAAALFSHFPQSSQGWYYAVGRLSDHTPRLITYRAVNGHPLIVTIGLSASELFSGVFAEQRLYNVAAAALTVVILIVNGFLVRGSWLRERMAQNLRTQNVRFNALLSNMPLGVCMFDSKGRLAIRNDRYLQMYHLSREEVGLG
jgi:two-component system, sensor histidine kinase